MGARMVVFRVLGVVLLACGTAACSVATSSFNDGSSVGGAVVGSLGTSPAAAAPPLRPVMGAFLEGPIGMRLGDADRDRAYQAEVDALASGDRKTWRGIKGNYGFVVLGSGETPESCRTFTHTVYIGGRPQTGTGTGCKGPGGAWAITG